MKFGVFCNPIVAPGAGRILEQQTPRFVASAIERVISPHIPQTKPRGCPVLLSRTVLR